QSVKSFADTVEKIIDISPDRIAVFNYAHVPWLKKHMSLIHAEDIPAPEIKLEILKTTIEMLANAGYVFIGMDHFAKPDDELSIALREKKLYRNFQGYSTNADADLYAMGITGISQLGKIYAQNFKTEKQYYESLDNETLPIVRGYQLNKDDLIRRFVIMRLMCDFELNFKQVEEKFKLNFRNYFAWGLKNLKEMEEDELIRIDDDKIEVTGMGRLLIRNVAMNFDGYIERKEDKAKYSRTI
ncbi:MAG TPA: oxygen-independent coproporphyrinogen III oxidase, partial [Ignavibacteriaceae bacterium]|nr:oxygen-independent coproporphyrinogen III oxidase [Ignavibacteriaceae bacterium]